MTEFFTVKKIDNSRLVRTIAPGRLAECIRLVALGGVLTGIALLYAWQHFHCIQLKYQLEDLKGQRTQAVELQQQLRLEVASLKAPGRIDAIARVRLGLSVPVPGQVTPAEAPGDAVVAQTRGASSAASR